MAAIQTISETKDASTAVDDKPVVDPMVEAVEAINTEYNASVEELATAEATVQDAQNKVFQLLLEVSKKISTAVRDADSLKESSEAYNDVFHELVALKEEVYAKQSVSFRLLQKLRQAHNNYLLAVVNTLQKENAELKKAQS
jgi:vacuolar-type H+-ATPase subunit I/STV1